MQQIIAQAHQSLGRSDGLVNLRNQEILGLRLELEEARSQLATVQTENETLRQDVASRLEERNRLRSQIDKDHADREELAQIKKEVKEAAAKIHQEGRSIELEKTRWQQQLSDARSEFEDAKATILAQGNKIRELERGYSFKPNPVESALRLEIGEVRAELEASKQQPPTEFELPEPADLLNQLKGRRKKSKADLGDVAAILELLGDR